MPAYEVVIVHSPDAPTRYEYLAAESLPGAKELAESMRLAAISWERIFIRQYYVTSSGQQDYRVLHKLTIVARTKS
jgi:hypothetical protein